MMAPKKKGLELVFHLEWRERSGNGVDKSIVIGMYDTPAATQNFETFKSYLQKNSGVDAQDVEIAYITDDNSEWFIESESGFKQALCAFRLKARLGEFVHLKLDKVLLPVKKSRAALQRKDSNDVHTQYDPEGCNQQPPPEWFFNYMKQFKRDLIQDVSTSVANAMATRTPEPEEVVKFDQAAAVEVSSEAQNLEPKVKIGAQNPEGGRFRVRRLPVEEPVEELACSRPPCCPDPFLLPPDRKPARWLWQPDLRCDLHTLVAGSSDMRQRVLELRQQHHLRKKCPEPSKRAKKHYPEHVIDKTLKQERKLEHKLDKLEAELQAKAKKIREKKESLLTKSAAKIEATVQRAEKANSSDDDVRDFGLVLDAALAVENGMVPHMMGGGTHTHTWEVINCGVSAWPERTVLRLTWGSAAMSPAERVIKCPPLQPGEKGTLSMRFLIPTTPGQYESYWNFYVDDTRFGRWVSCSVVVDGPTPSSPQCTLVKKPKLDEDADVDAVTKNENDNDESDVKEDNDKLIDLATRVQRLSMNIPESPNPADSDSDWESWSHLKPKNIDENFKSPNWYGVDEDDLIVDLSNKKSECDKDEFEYVREPVVIDKIEEKPAVIKDDDDNNNSDFELKKWDSNASDVSSSYDVVNATVCEDEEETASNDVVTSSLCSDKEERAGGYVYVTVEGNKLSLPKYMLHPDLVAAAEASTSNQLDRKSVTTDTLIEIDGASEIRSSKTPSSDASAPEGGGSARLFIFPQNNPGFEVLASQIKDEDNLNTDKVFCPTNKVEVMPSDPLQTYTWAQSQTQYTLSDVQNSAGSSHLRCDPYGTTERNKVPPNPFTAVPNYQQSPTRVNVKFDSQSSPPKSPPPPPPQSPQLQAAAAAAAAAAAQNTPPVHVLPENLMSGAVNVASSAINTARTVINMMIPQKSQLDKWVDGHWVPGDVNSKRYKNLLRLTEMGFWDMDLNATLLARYNDDVQRVVAELLTYK